MKEEEMEHDPYWPKWKYHANGKSKIVNSKKEEDFLGSAWKDSPADHGVVVYPHSEEYLAMNAVDQEHAQEPEHESVEEAVKPKRGRKPKEE